MHKVSIVRCSSYDEKIIKESIENVLKPLGGIEAFIKPGEKVLIKPNLLRAAAPEEAVTTHPLVIKAVIDIIKPLTASIVIADSPGAGYPYTVSNLARVYEKSGIKKIAQETNTLLNYCLQYNEVSNPEGSLIKKFEIIKPVIDADKIINIAKLKTHMLSRITGPVKNLFGVIPGISKPAYHSTLQKSSDFSAMLIDLYNLINPALNIVDAVTAMEGDGPSAGNPRQFGLIIAGRCGFAVEEVIRKILNEPIENIPLLKAAAERNLIPENIEIFGPKPEELEAPDFKWPQKSMADINFGRFNKLFQIIALLAKNLLALRLKTDKKKCTGCGVCVAACPVKAILIKNKKVNIINKKCIRCYCCHELCPQKAIKLQKHFIFKLIPIR